MLEALLRRLNPEDEDFSYFQDIFSRMKFGLEGESRVDREWREMAFFHEKPHYLLFNFEAESEQRFVEMFDTVLWT